MLPPGAYGTMIRIVLLGKVSACAAAATIAAASKEISQLLNDPNLCGMVTPAGGSSEIARGSKVKSAHETGTQGGRPGRIVDKHGTHQHIVQQPLAAIEQ